MGWFGVPSVLLAAMLISKAMWGTSALGKGSWPQLPRQNQEPDHGGRPARQVHNNYQPACCRGSYCVPPPLPIRLVPIRTCSNNQRLAVRLVQEEPPSRCRGQSCRPVPLRSLTEPERSDSFENDEAAPSYNSDSSLEADSLVSSAAPADEEPPLSCGIHELYHRTSVKQLESMQKMALALNRKADAHAKMIKHIEKEYRLTDLVNPYIHGQLVLLEKHRQIYKRITELQKNLALKVSAKTAYIKKLETTICVPDL